MPVLLVHGLFGSLQTVAAKLEAAGLPAVSPDLLGYGRHQSAGPPQISVLSQARHVLDFMDEQGLGQIDLVGHSAGAMVAMLIAYMCPERIRSVYNVEGNFTLQDAVWSRRFAYSTEAEVRDLLDTYRLRPEIWLSSAHLAPSPSNIALANSLLGYQPASTLRAMAQSIILMTETFSYLLVLRRVFEGPVAVHLVAGTDSSAGWDVPPWAVASAQTVICIPGGHFMPLENPDAFVSCLIELGHPTHLTGVT